MKGYDADMADGAKSADIAADADGWTSVPDIDARLDEWELPDLDLLAELTHPVRSRIIRALDEPRTVAEVASRLDVPVTRLYHHVNRLESLGLIRVVATRRVSAVTERRYQTVASSFRVAQGLRTSTDPQELAVALGALFDVAKLGFQRHVERGGYRQAADDADSFLSLGESRLSPERRAQLMERLRALIEEFGHQHDPGEDASAISLFIAASPGTA